MVNNDNPIRDKSKKFAFRIIKLYQYLVDKKEYVLSKQILRSGTSIGANVAEEVVAESKPDFIHKLSIALKEASETLYWLELLKDGSYISEESCDSMSNNCVELIKLSKSIINTTKKNLK